MLFKLYFTLILYIRLRTGLTKNKVLRKRGHGKNPEPGRIDDSVLRFSLLSDMSIHSEIYYMFARLGEAPPGWFDLPEYKREIRSSGYRQRTLSYFPECTQKRDMATKSNKKSSEVVL